MAWLTVSISCFCCGTAKPNGSHTPTTYRRFSHAGDQQRAEAAGDARRGVGIKRAGFCGRKVCPFIPRLCANCSSFFSNKNRASLIYRRKDQGTKIIYRSFFQKVDSNEFFLTLQILWREFGRENEPKIVFSFACQHQHFLNFKYAVSRRLKESNFSSFWFMVISFLKLIWGWRFFSHRISDGLDSIATLDLVRKLQIWCRAMNVTMVVSVMQPPPEVLCLPHCSHF